MFLKITATIAATTPFFSASWQSYRFCFGSHGTELSFLLPEIQHQALLINNKDQSYNKIKPDTEP